MSDGLGPRIAALAACSALLALPTLAPAKPATAPAPDRVQVQGSEFNLVLSKKKLIPGRAIVQFVNAGEDSHNLRLQRLAPDGSQVGPELGTGEVAPGDYENIDAQLRKGSRYVLWCSLQDHRQRGMEATLRTRKHRG
jgi:hypothetical protein